MRDDTTLPKEPDGDRKAAYAILRLCLGMNMLLHGAVRIPHLAAFANGMTLQFQGTVLPGFAVQAFGWLLPFVEGLVGLLLVLGWRTRTALVAGGLFMVILVTGTALRSDWQALGTQMLYSALYYLLLCDIRHNGFSLDAWFSRGEDGYKLKGE
jgi:thiosulfate dehydrogenase [quinone] large subunit